MVLNLYKSVEQLLLLQLVPPQAASASRKTDELQRQASSVPSGPPRPCYPAHCPFPGHSSLVKYVLVTLQTSVERLTASAIQYA